jgi:hypothetical protein
MSRRRSLTTLAVGFGGLLACHGPEPRHEPHASVAEGERSTTVASSTPAVPVAGPANLEALSDSAGAGGPASTAVLASLAGSATAIDTPPSECSSPRAWLRLPKDDGAVFDNAMTEAESKRKDRTRGVLAALRSQERALRCCFDPWVDGAGAPEGRALLRFTLEADGTVREAGFERARSDIQSPGVAACVAGVVRATRFPVSPSGRDTTIEYPLRVRRGS